MRRLLRFALFVSLLALFTGIAHAQCGVTYGCVSSFSISPGEIMGDGSHFATGTITDNMAPNEHGEWTVLFTTSGGPGFYCENGTPVYAQLYGCHVTGSTAEVVFFEFNGSGSPATLPVKAQDDPDRDPGISQTLIVDSMPTSQPTDPDVPCPTNACAGKPISLTNGDTWITQQDYQMPGIAGGFTLTRTWNSLWTNLGGPEEVGIFGDSWRSNIEERIQVLTGGVVKYWKGIGSSLIYSYNSLNGTYSLTAPTNDQTTLAYNSTSQVWVITEKSGTQRIFNNAGYLTSIVDLNGNTTTINVDASNQNRIDSVTDPSGHVVTFIYTDVNNPRLCTSISDSVGTFTQYQYDDATKRLLQVEYPDSSQYNFQYNDPNSNTLISLVIDSAGKTVEGHTYDSQRRGITSFQANDSNGNAVNKVTVTYGYQYPWVNLLCDSMGNQNCTYVYVTSFNQRRYISKTTGGNNACNTCGFLANSSYKFSDIGYPAASADADGNVTLYQYDANGNLQTKTLPIGNGFSGQTGEAVWNYTYNSFGEMLTATDPLGSGPGDPNHTTTWAYDTQRPDRHLRCQEQPHPVHLLPRPVPLSNHFPLRLHRNLWVGPQ